MLIPSKLQTKNFIIKVYLIFMAMQTDEAPNELLSINIKRREIEDEKKY